MLQYNNCGLLNVFVLKTDPSTLENRSVKITIFFDKSNLLKCDTIEKQNTLEKYLKKKQYRNILY